MTAASDHDDLLPVLLEICEDFFTHTSTTTRDELDTVLRAHGITGGPGWLIDMLALTRRRDLNVGQQHGGFATQKTHYLGTGNRNQPFEDGTVDGSTSDPNLGE